MVFAWPLSACVKKRIVLVAGSVRWAVIPSSIWDAGGKVTASWGGESVGQVSAVRQVDQSCHPATCMTWRLTHPSISATPTDTLR